MTINLDFDGTVVSHEFPYIGKDIGSIPVLKRLIDAEHQLILFTMRCDNPEKGTFFLTEAINWFKENDIPLYGIQKNPTQGTWTSSNKSYAELMIDDSALGCPLIWNRKLSNRPYIDWNEIETMLEDRGILKTRVI